jgi:Tfp pilus assembly protein PilN
MASATGRKIGIALGAASATAVVMGKRGMPTAQVAVDLEGGTANLAEQLPQAFAELKTKLEKAGAGSTEGATVSVSLLPPLADARLISLPPLRKREVEAVLTRDVARHFLGPDRPRVVGVRMPKREGNGGVSRSGDAVPVLAAAAQLSLLEELQGSLARVGWRRGSLSVAHQGWLAAATRLKGAPVRGVLALVDQTAHVLRLRDGNPETVRQIPLEDASEWIEALGAEGGRVLVLAPPRTTDMIRSQLGREGWSVSVDPEGWGSAEEGAAARITPGSLELVPPGTLVERAKQKRRTTLGMVGAAAVLLLASAGIQWWGLQRELDAAREQRSAIRSQVEPLLLARDSLDTLRARLQGIEGVAETSPVWTRALVELTNTLPRNTYLTSFFASGDTVEIEAAGADAGEAIQALREAGLFEDLRLQGMVERDLEEGETVQERFSLRARLPSRHRGGTP